MPENALHHRQLVTPAGTRHIAAIGHSDVPIVMLHGVTRNSQCFRPVIDSLSACHRLDLLDFRGHGRSEKVDCPYRVIDYVEDVIHLINTDHSHGAVVYGHSLGAMVAAATAAALPSKVTAIILEDPPFHTMGDHIAISPLHSYFAAIQEFAADPRPIAKVARDLAEIRFGPPNDSTSIRLGDTRDEPTIRMMAACLSRLDSAVLNPIVAGNWLQGYDLDDIIASIECPILLLQADPDCGGMLTDMDVEKFKTHSSDVTVLRFDGCGHQIHWHRTAQLLNASHSFLASLDLGVAP